MPNIPIAWYAPDAAAATLDARVTKNHIHAQIEARIDPAMTIQNTKPGTRFADGALGAEGS
jgi:hypothetical protein